MMAAMIYYLYPGVSFAETFLYAEVVGHLTNQTKGGELMVMMYMKNVLKHLKQLSDDIKYVWENHRTFRFHLLMIR